MLPDLLFEALKKAPLDSLLWCQAADALEEIGEIGWAQVFRARAQSLAVNNHFDYYPLINQPENTRWLMVCADDLTDTNHYLVKQPDEGRSGCIHWL